jgi:hypothetical protein
MLAIVDKVNGLDHPGVAKIFDNLAVICRKTGREADALEFENRAIAIRAIAK